MISLLTHTIQNSAARNPGDVAFKCANNCLTYQELVIRSNQLAHLLIEWGVKKGDRVGVYLHRSLETAIAIYGIMQAGAVYVPLDPYAPITQTRSLIKDCDIRHLITHPLRQASVTELTRENSGLNLMVGLEGEWSVPVISWKMLTKYPTHNPEVIIREDDLAYIMYTSGSTGTPKGIMHTHRSGLSYANLSAALYGLNTQDRLASHAPLHFDMSTLAYFTAPLVGACSVIISEAHTKMPASLTELIELEEITVWYSTPLALMQMMTHGALDQRNMDSLRWVLFGGEPFPIKYLKGLIQQWPSARFCNVYGPAEVNQCTYYHLPGPPVGKQDIPIGKVWEETEMAIINDSDLPVQIGEPGELLISSTTMMKGYWRQPELTARSLFSLNIGEKTVTYYRTGDLVRQDIQGNLIFLGRKDRQIKTRGYRVELDMIEAHLVAFTWGG